MTKEGRTGGNWKGGSEKIVGLGGGEGTENLYTSKLTGGEGS